MVIAFFKFIFYSILIVLVSKYLLVRILRKIGELLKLKSKTVGFIAGIATSIPELLTVSFSAITGLLDTSVYNILSSNVINTIQYSGAIVLNKNQKVLRNKALRLDLLLVIITILIPIFMMLFRLESQLWLVPLFIILFFVFYRISGNAHKLYIYKKENKDIVNEKEISRISVEKYTRKTIITVIIQILLLILVGALLYLIGEKLSYSLEQLSRSFNISEWFLGVLLGFITSLPELITFFEAQRHHSSEREGVVEATSNLLTSNIMNLFIIQSIGILIYLFLT